MNNMKIDNFYEFYHDTVQSDNVLKNHWYLHIQ